MQLQVSYLPLSRQIGVNKPIDAAVIFALLHWWWAIVQELLSRGADVNSLGFGSDDIFLQSDSFPTIYRAIFLQSIEAVRMLLRHGVHLNAKLDVSQICKVMVQQQPIEFLTTIEWSPLLFAINQRREMIG
jgi:hypothetical protein